MRKRALNEKISFGQKIPLIPCNHLSYEAYLTPMEKKLKCKYRFLKETRYDEEVCLKIDVYLNARFQKYSYTEYIRDDANDEAIYYCKSTAWF